MQINHLHLHVRDVSRSRAFYERHFGMRLKREIKPDFIFLTDDAGMDFALSFEEENPKAPDWFHFGFRLETPELVKQMHARMKSEGARVSETIGVYGKRVTFSVDDPDGYGVEVYFE